MLIRRVQRGPAGSFVALWRNGDEPDPDSVFRADPDEIPTPDGAAEGTVLGEYSPNGALVVDLEGRWVRPICNPQRPAGDQIRRLRSSHR